MGELVHTGSKYSDAQRREACLLYSIEGVMTKVSSTLNMRIWLSNRGALL